MAFPLSELPRERLLRDGVEALSMQELLAILLGTGTKGKSVLLLAHELLNHFGGLKGLCEASVEELMQVKGIGQAKAILLKAAFGIATKSAKQALGIQKRLKSSQEAFEIAHSVIGHFTQEVLMVMLCDVRGAMIHHEVISVGTLSEVLVHPREIFYPAVRHRAYSLTIVHNHPSGDPTPSERDLLLTRHLVTCAKLMGFKLDDHLILGNQRFFSLRDEGFLSSSPSEGLVTR